MRELLVATNNDGKLAEFRRLLSGLPVRVMGPAEIGLELNVPEPHLTYADNARDKALAFARASGRLTLADDSGIEVAALDWGPGARSARWGGVELFSGTVEGSVAAGPRGSAGFGYDPIFELPSGLTTAELAPEEKDRVSHRGQAVAAASPRIRSLAGAP